MFFQPAKAMVAVYQNYHPEEQMDVYHNCPNKVLPTKNAVQHQTLQLPAPFLYHTVTPSSFEVTKKD